jgi:hypothetical protein
MDELPLLSGQRRTSSGAIIDCLVDADQASFLDDLQPFDSSGTYGSHASQENTQPERR